MTKSYGMFSAGFLSPRFRHFLRANVLRKIRQKPTRFERARNWFSVRKVVGASAVAAVFVAIALVTHYPGPRTTSSSDPDVVAKDRSTGL